MVQNTKNIVRGIKVMATQRMIMAQEQRLDTERIARMEAQMENLKSDVADVKQDIKELHSRITTTTREITDHIDTKLDALGKIDSDQHSAMSKKIDQMKDRIDTLEKWRYMIVGGAIVLGYLVGHLEFFNNLMK
jgi:putative NADH-flavin reductase